MWFTETPWPPIFVCALVAALMLVKWSTSHRGIFLVGAAAMLVLSVGIFFFERAVVTEAERIEANVLALAEAVKQDDAERALGFFSPRAEHFKQQVANAMVLYKIGEDLRITDLSVRMRAENSIGVSRFRANGTVTGKASSLGGRGATRWDMTWQREAGEWKITEIVRLHPIREGETLGLTDRME